jgi:hypothetical protein
MILNNFPFGSTFKFQTELNENSRKQTNFEFGLNLLGVQTSLKDLINSSKFYHAFIFMNINLVFHVCMPKCGVSKHGPNGLV